MPIIILSDEDRNFIAEMLQRKASWMKREFRKDVTDLTRLATLIEKAPSEHTIRIIVQCGDVEDVERMPMGFHYEVQDFDVCSECGRVEPFCDFCLNFLDKV